MSGDAAFGMLTLNLFLLVLGVVMIVYGARESSLGQANLGMGLLSAVILLRFFDTDLSFVERGTAFIVLGLAFLTMNFLLTRKRGLAS